MSQNERRGWSRFRAPEPEEPTLPDPQPEPIQRRGGAALDDPPPKKPGKRAKLKAHKRRRHAMSIAVSEEEEAILREFCDENGITFSRWARDTLFQAMGRRMPRRY